MATDPTLADPLYLLRRSIKSNQLPVPTTSDDPDTTTDDLSTATHLYFTHPTEQALPLTTTTRFISDASPVDLRSIFFAFQKKDVPIPEYIESAQQLNSALKDANAGAEVRNLKFVERLDLITWLESASDETEYIQPLEGAEKGDAVAELSAQAAAPTAPVASVTAGGRPTKPIDARLQEIYNGERRMGDRNSILRGIKPTDFSHIRKTAETFLHRSRAANRPGQKPGAKSTATPTNQPLASHIKPKTPSIPSTPSSTTSSTSSRRPDPIILLSPSASSLLRLSNIKSFLSSGTYVPPNHPVHSTDTTSLSILHISRTITSISNSSPTRFILVDTPDQFKPDYWNRVVAVFTTGQTWQFKSYKWRDPQELFRHVLGVYVGWKGETVPDTVKGWGRGVQTYGVEKWVEGAHGRDGGRSRWSDREVVENIWRAIEDMMRRRGWGKEGPKV